MRLKFPVAFKLLINKYFLMKFLFYLLELVTCSKSHTIDTRILSGSTFLSLNLPSFSECLHLEFFNSSWIWSLSYFISNQGELFNSQKISNTLNHVCKDQEFLRRIQYTFLSSQKYVRGHKQNITATKFSCRIKKYSIQA